jgi:prophage maintenance system killer protein
MISFPATPDSVKAIEATVANINGSNFGIENYPSDTEKIVAYFYFLIKNHPFVDGNKRTASLVFLVLIETNGLEKHFEGYDLDALAIFMESVDVSEYKEAIKFLSSKIFKV